MEKEEGTAQEEIVPLHSAGQKGSGIQIVTAACVSWENELGIPTGFF